MHIRKAMTWRARAILLTAAVIGALAAPVKQDNGRFWLYVYGYCSTDRVINGNTVVKVSETRPTAVASL